MTPYLNAGRKLGGSESDWLDNAGVSWAGAQRPLAWNAVDRLVVNAAARRWRLLGRYGEVGLIDKTQAAFGRRAHSAQLRHLIDLQLTGGDVEQVLDAIAHRAAQLVNDQHQRRGLPKPPPDSSRLR